MKNTGASSIVCFTILVLPVLLDEEYWSFRYCVRSTILVFQYCTCTNTGTSSIVYVNDTGITSIVNYNTGISSIVQCYDTSITSIVTLQYWYFQYCDRLQYW